SLDPNEAAGRLLAPGRGDPRFSDSLALDGSLFLRDPHHAHADARAGVAGRVGLQVVGLLVEHDRATDDRVGAGQRDHRVLHLALRLALRVGLDVPEVADVALGRRRPAVLLPFRVEVAARALAVGAVGVAELVDVEAVLAGRQPLQVPAHLHALRRRLELDDAVHR